MPPRPQLNVRLDEDLYEGLQEVFERDAVAPAEQVRRAVRRYLEERGVIPPQTKTARKREAPRSRA